VPLVFVVGSAGGPFSTKTDLAFRRNPLGPDQLCHAPIAEYSLQLRDWMTLRLHRVNRLGLHSIGQDPLLLHFL
jgi:hypothetical protein